MLTARLIAYEAGGARLGPMPFPLTVSPMVAHNDTGSLTFTYSDLAAGGEHLATALQDGLEVALEVSTGPGADDWAEPKACRFVRLEDDGDTSDPTKAVNLTVPSFAWLLSKCVLSGTGAIDGKRVFTDPTVGSILGALLSENSLRGGYASSIAVTFTDTLDSAGATWPTLPTQSFEVGTDYLTILEALTAAGACDWTTQARGLYLYLPDAAALSPDVSGDDGVALALGVEVAGAPTKRSIAEMAGRVWVLADAGGVTTAEEPTATTGWGMPESTLRIGQVSDEAAAIAAGEAYLEQVGRPGEQFTRDLVLENLDQVPFINFWQGCWITAPGAAGQPAKLRVQQMTFTLGRERSGSLTLNDILLDGEERRSRTLAALAGGTISPGGPPAPIAVDPEASRVPSTPTGLTVGAALDFIGATPRGVVTASWDAVTTGTDTGPMNISGYELQWRIAAGDWQSGSTAELSAQIRDLTPGDSVDTRVRAVGARTTFPSAWSAIQNVVVPGDVTPPSVPSAPTVTSRLGFVSVTWDGLSDTAAAMEEDFARVEIAMGETPTPTTVVGFLTREGTAPIAGQTYGAEVQVRLRSVDTSGNASDWSAVSDPIVVRAVDGPDLEANSVTTNALTAGSVTGEILAGQILLGSTITTAESGQRVTIDESGIRLHDADETVRVSLPTEPGQDAQFRGRVEADGLTVRQGASFYSPWNEFARDSVINLAEQVEGPVASPIPEMIWDRVPLEQVAYDDLLGNFALDPSQIIGVGRDFEAGGNRILIFQKRPGGTRIWYYEMDGTLSPLVVEGQPHPFQDWEDWTITGGIYTDSAKYWFGQWAVNGNWYFRNGSTGNFTEYQTGNVTNRVAMGWNGTDYLVVDRASGKYRLRRVDPTTNPVTVLGSVPSDVDALSPQINFIWQGPADFGTTRWVVGHESSGAYRTLSTTGVYSSEYDWRPGHTRMGGFWNSANSLFYTISSSGYLVQHTDLAWTDPALDTWHMGQSFVDTNPAGDGTHETALGSVASFTMFKRAKVRFTLADVPFSGEDDDPNGWVLYGKRGTAPGSPADMVEQGSGTYLQNTFVMSEEPTTVGAVAKSVGDFPGANPARLRSGRTYPDDPALQLFEVRGDGSGQWGPFRVESDGQWAWNGNTSQWNQFTLNTGWSHVTDEELEYTWRFGVMYVQGRVTAGASATSNVATIPFSDLYPTKTIRGGIQAWETGANTTRRVQVFSDTGIIQIAGSVTSGNTYAFNFQYPYEFFLEW